ncbi:MAG: T9SS type A sorting domain-containing protein [Xanthomarina gelatinilytica]|uniref:T9SS type A sorting domain-containing protein n=1 Tax=Xanthomarina gelatinilytica TaxID=1137281 RepID=UPI003A8C65EA
MKQTYLNLFFVLIGTISFSQTFDWETATDSGNGIVQTVSGITATFTSSYAANDVRLFNPGGYAGSSGNVVYTYQIDSGTSATVTFSAAVNITSVFVLDPQNDSNGQQWVLTPTGGGNSAVTQTISSANGTTVSLNWTNVTSFTITNGTTGAADSFALDDIVFTASTLSTTDFGLDNKIVYPIPSSDFIYIKGVSGIKNYSLYNHLGAKVMSNTIANNNKIDIQNLTSGLYFLKFDNGKTTKFIKK